MDAPIRLPFEMATLDPAFVRCLQESIEVPELVQNFDRLYGARLATRPDVKQVREFAKFVHDCIYMRLPDEAIHSLRGA